MQIVQTNAEAPVTSEDSVRQSVIVENVIDGDTMGTIKNYGAKENRHYNILY